MDMDRALAAQEDLAAQEVQEALALAVLAAPALADLEDLEVLAEGQAMVDPLLHHLEAAMDAVVCHL